MTVVRLGRCRQCYRTIWLRQPETRVLPEVLLAMVDLSLCMRCVLGCATWSEVRRKFFITEREVFDGTETNESECA